MRAEAPVHSTRSARVHTHGHGLQSHRFVTARACIGPFARNLLCRERRWNLQILPAQRCKRSLDRVTLRHTIGSAGFGASDVVGVRRDAESNGGFVVLVRRDEEPHESRGPTARQRQDARCQGVERSGVADTSLVKRSPAQPRRRRATSGPAVCRRREHRPSSRQYAVGGMQWQASQVYAQLLTACRLLFWRLRSPASASPRRASSDRRSRRARSSPTRWCDRRRRTRVRWR